METRATWTAAILLLYRKFPFRKRPRLMHQILVPDIFGVTKAFRELAAALPFTTEIVDPYMGESFEFENEKAAYEHFQQHVGLTRYSNQLRDVIAAVDHDVRIIAFSIGAAATWNVSDSPPNDYVRQAICFYGSQIRHRIDVQPKFAVSLVLPKSETHFCVEELANAVQDYSNVQIERTPYLHGFMNRESGNYDQGGFDHFSALLCAT